MLEDMTWDQLLSWREYYAIDPWGEERADVRAAQICSILANANRDPKRHPKPYTVKDFMPDFGGGRVEGKGSRKPLTDPEQWARFKAGLKSGMAGAK